MKTNDRSSIFLNFFNFFSFFNFLRVNCWLAGWLPASASSATSLIARHSVSWPASQPASWLSGWVDAWSAGWGVWLADVAVLAGQAGASQKVKKVKKLKNKKKVKRKIIGVHCYLQCFLTSGLDLSGSGLPKKSSKLSPPKSSKGGNISSSKISITVNISSS